jgi:hypothetical protein
MAKVVNTMKKRIGIENKKALKNTVSLLFQNL